MHVLDRWSLTMKQGKEMVLKAVDIYSHRYRQSSGKIKYTYIED